MCHCRGRGGDTIRIVLGKLKLKNSFEDDNYSNGLSSYYPVLATSFLPLLYNLIKIKMYIHKNLSLMKYSFGKTEAQK